VLETGSNPVVFGERRAPGAARTLLVYCHFDTKPAPPAGWLQPSPFEPVLRAGLAEEGAPIVGASEVRDDALPGHRLYARGASDDKGPIWAHLEALALMDALGIAPRVHVKLLLEGEEEVGSPGFGAFVAANRDLLAADLVLVTDGPKDATERPTVVFGARGILALTLELEAARRDVHSGNFSVPNPAWTLIGLLASMAAPGGTPLIEGLAADATPPTAAERELLGRIPLDRPALERELGVRLAPDYLERLMFRPTLTIRGLRAGAVGEEANTIIPHRATVALDLRLVKNQRAEAVYRRVVEHVRGQGFTVIESADAPLPDELRGRAVRVVERHGYDPAKTPVDLPISRRVVEIVERAHDGQSAVVVPTAGGSVPLWAFTDLLELPTIVVPYANANNRQHSPNEHIRLDHLYQGIRTTARLLLELGE
jgi:acetylornithine deacetylase/succinyl-diaminopimelate desuccinylase-like protein